MEFYAVDHQKRKKNKRSIWSAQKFFGPSSDPLSKTHSIIVISFLIITLFISSKFLQCPSSVYAFLWSCIGWVSRGFLGAYKLHNILIKIFTVCTKFWLISRLKLCCKSFLPDDIPSYSTFLDLIISFLFRLQILCPFYIV